ncbi:uncharacterized protein LOC135124694 [Zophobas morio]|uniref:uncharacterized protein LOC135124694 n=1 Tax=Zophobas morio TaxID=2755281 RepID=UPI003082AA0D
MESTGNETLDRIQREIQEALQREEELRQKYNLLNNNEPEAHTNGFKTPSPEPPTPAPRAPVANGLDTPKTAARLFAPNVSSKGVMQKFLKMRGKMNMVTMKPKVETQSSWVPEETFEPAKVTIEAGRPIRNGYVSAEEKMKRELMEFQKREAELRLERKKSQPDLMAALEKEQEVQTNLQPARSMAQFYSSEDLTEEGGPVPRVLKRGKSLAELCDTSDEELESRRTHSLIMQFENLKSQS